jgi:hypothetical protein
MRLMLISDAKGVPVGYDLVAPKTGQEREHTPWSSPALIPAACCTQTGGFLGKEYHECMDLNNIRLITPERHRPGNRPDSAVRVITPTARSQRHASAQ